jgi:hypothetical protein
MDYEKRGQVMLSIVAIILSHHGGAERTKLIVPSEDDVCIAHPYHRSFKQPCHDPCSYGDAAKHRSQRGTRTWASRQARMQGGRVSG